MIGTNARLVVDYHGKPLVDQMTAALADRGQAELDYLWSNPVTGLGEHKHTFLHKIDNTIVGVGYYAR